MRGGQPRRYRCMPSTPRAVNGSPAHTDLTILVHVVECTVQPGAGDSGCFRRFTWWTACKGGGFRETRAQAAAMYFVCRPNWKMWFDSSSETRYRDGAAVPHSLPHPCHIRHMICATSSPHPAAKLLARLTIHSRLQCVVSGNVLAQYYTPCSRPLHDKPPPPYVEHLNLSTCGGVERTSASCWTANPPVTPLASRLSLSTRPILRTCEPDHPRRPGQSLVTCAGMLQGCTH